MQWRVCLRSQCLTFPKTRYRTFWQLASTTTVADYKPKSSFYAKVPESVEDFIVMIKRFANLLFALFGGACPLFLHIVNIVENILQLSKSARDMMTQSTKAAILWIILNPKSRICKREGRVDSGILGNAAWTCGQTHGNHTCWSTGATLGTNSNKEETKHRWWANWGKNLSWERNKSLVSTSKQLSIPSSNPLLTLGSPTGNRDWKTCVLTAAFTPVNWYLTRKDAKVTPCLACVPSLTVAIWCTKQHLT